MERPQGGSHEAHDGHHEAEGPTINAHEQGYAWMAVWYCDEEAGDCDVATEFGMTMHKVELRRVAGRMMARLCEGGYHLDAIRLLTDLVQDVA